MKSAWVIAAAGMSLVPVQAHAMTVATFLAKANGLKAKGILAMGSPDIGLLRNEMQRVAEAYRADVTRARAAGRTPHSCPPPKGQGKIGAKEVMAEFEAIPPAQRNVSVKTAFYAMMKKRYPCS